MIEAHLSLSVCMSVAIAYAWNEEQISMYVAMAID